jgi:hypothetical protein
MRIQKKQTKQTLGVVLALMMLTGWFALPGRNSTAAANPVTSSANPLIGIWEMTVQGEQGTYLYKYAISEGAWVTIGNIDGGLYNFRYGPTLGAYVKNTDGSYRYREIGWTYTRGGVKTGSFESTGTFVLDASGNSFSGPGSFKQFDLAGNTILTENFTVLATRDPV